MLYHCYIVTKNVTNYQKLVLKNFYEKIVDRQTALYYNRGTKAIGAR